MRTIWKGYLKVSLVTIPVKMYNATTKRRPIQFNQLHEACNTRIQEKKYCPKCDKTLSNDDIVKGYRYGKDAYVIMEEEDFEKAQQESTDSIDVFKFVGDGQISPIFYVNAHYLVPDGKAGAETFALFLKAMEETGKNAMGKMVMRNKESLLTIAPYDGAMVAYSLHYAEEILDHHKVYDPEDIEKVEVDKKSLDMARNIIENLTGDFTPEAHEDEYTKTLEKIIEAKVEGEEVQIAPREEEGKVINLMDALKKSVKETEKAPKKEMAKAGRKKKKKESAKKQKKG
jgi:DNA end-binding protein Ku